jgi:serine/threonine protein kinase
MALRIAHRFHVTRKLASGSFGEIYIAIDSTCGCEIALKLEPIRGRTAHLDSEAVFYDQLADGIGIPSVCWFGCEAQFRILAMERLGESLESLKRRVGAPFSLKTVLMIVDQTLTRVEFLHRRNVIHRDVKPDNFLIGLGNKANLIYVIDFGLSVQYTDVRTGQHIAESADGLLTGTARYASVNAMQGLEQSRRDDLLSLGYVWLYLLRGSLPWQGLPASARVDKKQQILEKKLSLTAEELCEGLPREFAEYFAAVGRLNFGDEPPYAVLKWGFRELFLRAGFVCDYQFDWVGLPEAPDAARAAPKTAAPPVAGRRPIVASKTVPPVVRSSIVPPLRAHRRPTDAHGPALLPRPARR